MSVGPVSSLSLATPPQGGNNDYSVQRGDTLSGIAKRHGVSLSALMAANPQINNPNLIYPGQAINIPGGGGNHAPSAPSGPVSGGATPSTLPGRIDQAVGYFQSQGWTHAQASGIVANLVVESAHTLDPHIQQFGGGPGYGIAQWEHPRQALFAQVMGHDIHSATLGEELQFVQWELTHTESGAGNKIRATTNAYDAGMAVCRYYERPANPNQPARGQLAQQIAANASPTPAPNPGPTPHPNPAPAPAPHPPSGDYTVRSGDTLSTIAARNHVSLAALERANPQIHNPNMIYVGQKIHLPGSQSSTPTPATHTYTVRSGDNMSSIATRNHVSLAALVHANPQVHNPNRIYPGQKLHVPGQAGSPAPSPAPKPASHDYSVRSGDTMSTIAARNHVSLAALERANPQISNYNRIYVGQTIHIPGAGASGPVQGPSPSTPSGSSGSKVVDIATSFQGRNASELKRSGALPMNPNVPSNICCANFVSAVLQKAGVLNVHTDLVSGSSRTGTGVRGSIGQILKARGWHVVDAAHARPGDVAIVNNGHHVELVASNNHGNIRLIGSNNVNADGTQRISYSNPYGNAWYLSPP